MSAPPPPERLAIIVLGSPNDEEGRLSTQAVSRLELALAEYRRHPGSRILLTGGFGPHFNTTTRPHSDYARDFLEGRGLPAGAFLGPVPSSNTVEDAVLAGGALEAAGISRAIVTTSDFHLERARFVFSRVLPWLEAEYRGAPTVLPGAELAALADHEAAALGRLRRDGIVYRGRCFDGTP